MYEPVMALSALPNTSPRPPAAAPVSLVLVVYVIGLAPEPQNFTASATLNSRGQPGTVSCSPASWLLA